MLRFYLQLLMDKSLLTKEQAEAATLFLLEEADPHQVAAFLALLKYKGETANEILGILAALQKKMRCVHLNRTVLDIVGTGGDLANTVNISTGSALLAAACGVPIAKHGNRAISSQSGSADVLEEFGIDIEASPQELDCYLKEIGITFMFAPHYHPSLKKLASLRKGLNMPTVLNLLGPLLNPAGAEYALIGVAKESDLNVLCEVIMSLESRKRTLLFHGSGLDELTPLGKVVAYDIQQGRICRLEMDPIALGFTCCTLKQLQGGNARENASILKHALSGKPSAVADALIFTAGAAIWIFGSACTLMEGIHYARDVLKQGKALTVLEKWIELSKRLKLERTT